MNHLNNSLNESFFMKSFFCINQSLGCDNILTEDKTYVLVDKTMVYCE